MYDSVIAICFSLTNFHIELHPLRNSDLDQYKKVMNKYYAEAKKKRKEKDRIQLQHKRRKRMRRDLSSVALNIV